MTDLSRQIVETDLNHYASIKEDIKRAYGVCRSHEDKVKRLQAELESSKRDLLLSTQILADLQKNRVRVLEKVASYVTGVWHEDDSTSTPTPVVSPKEDSVDRGFWPCIRRLEDELWAVSEADEAETNIEVFDDKDKAEDFLYNLLVERGLIPSPWRPKMDSEPVLTDAP